MTASAKKKPADASAIAVNRRARHDYFIQEVFESGLVLEGWEVKSLRGGRAQIREAYVIMRAGEAFLLGAHITPLASASTHVLAEPTRTRKLLLHSKQLSKLIGAVDQQGFTLIPLRLYWRRGLAKLEFGLAKGKKKFDKRESIKDRDWARRKERILRH